MQAHSIKIAACYIPRSKRTQMSCLNMQNKLSSHMGKRSLKYKTGDIHQRRENVLRPISWTQIANSL